MRKSEISNVVTAGWNRLFRRFSLNANGHTDPRMDGRTHGRTDPLIEMRGRIYKIVLMHLCVCSTTISVHERSRIRARHAGRKKTQSLTPPNTLSHTVLHWSPISSPFEGVWKDPLSWRLRTRRPRETSESQRSQSSGESKPSDHVGFFIFLTASSLRFKGSDLSILIK